jgi:hypothetical protein
VSIRQNRRRHEVELTPLMTTLLSATSRGGREPHGRDEAETLA